MGIISISGKIGAGKDEVGKIIQYLTHCKDDNTSYEEFCNTIHQDFSKWKIKKFAYKLKQISAIILGCKVEDFEDRDFKDKELGPEWWYYKWQGRLINYRDAESMRPLVPWFESTEELVKLTHRTFLQILSTDAGRDIVHPNIWVNALFSDYKKYAGYAIWDAKEKKGILKVTQEESMWILTDTRFLNELEAIEARGGVTIRVVRPRITLGGGDDLYEHSSETALDNAEFDYEIRNDGTVEDLIEKVKSILIEEKII